MLPLFPRELPWAGGLLPLSGAHSAEQLLLLVIANARGRYTQIAHSEKRGFVKKYSNFEPKKQGVLVTKESFGRKNASF